MKNILTLLFCIMIGTSGLFAGTSQYQANDDAVDALISNAVELSISDISVTVNDELGLNSLAPVEHLEEKDPLVAFLICWVAGYLGIHRLYLGTKTGTFVIYLLTLGGCGIVAFVDWIMLLLALIDDKNISQYVDNPKFIMW